jgi:hypothetical protein
MPRRERSRGRGSGRQRSGGGSLDRHGEESIRDGRGPTRDRHSSAPTDTTPKGQRWEKRSINIQSQLSSTDETVVLDEKVRVLLLPPDHLPIVKQFPTDKYVKNASEPVESRYHCIVPESKACPDVIVSTLNLSPSEIEKQAYPEKQRRANLHKFNRVVSRQRTLHMFASLFYDCLQCGRFVMILLLAKSKCCRLHSLTYAP